MTVNCMHLLPSNPDHAVVSVKGSHAYLVNAMSGQLLRTFSSGRDGGSDFLCSMLSPQGRWLYCGAEDGKLYMFDVAAGSCEDALEVTARELIGIAHHPFRSLVSTIDDSGQLTLWKP